jgi:hypothetical protein
VNISQLKLRSEKFGIIIIIIIIIIIMFSLCLVAQHTSKAHERVEIYLHVFFVSALETLSGQPYA